MTRFEVRIELNIAEKYGYGHLEDAVTEVFNKLARAHSIEIIRVKVRGPGCQLKRWRKLYPEHGVRAWKRYPFESFNLVRSARDVFIDGVKSTQSAPLRTRMTTPPTDLLRTYWELEDYVREFDECREYLDLAYRAAAASNPCWFERCKQDTLQIKDQATERKKRRLLG